MYLPLSELHFHFLNWHKQDFSAFLWLFSLNSSSFWNKKCKIKLKPNNNEDGHVCRNVKRTQTWMWECIFFFSFCRLWFLSSSSSTLDSRSWRISSNSCFRERRRTLISSASANSSVSAWSCSARIFFSSRSFRTKKQFEHETFPCF